MKKRVIWLFFVVLALSIFYCSCSYGAANELKTGTEKVILTGRLTLETFLDANDKAEEEYILLLERPINVIKDEFGGPDKDITKVQTVFYSDTEAWRKAPKLINKKVTIKGTLFHSHTAHHHTKVLIEVIEINKLE